MQIQALHLVSTVCMNQYSWQAVPGCEVLLLLFGQVCSVSISSVSVTPQNLPDIWPKALNLHKYYSQVQYVVTLSSTSQQIAGQHSLLHERTIRSLRWSIHLNGVCSLNPGMWGLPPSSHQPALTKAKSDWNRQAWSRCTRELLS